MTWLSLTSAAFDETNKIVQRSRSAAAPNVRQNSCVMRHFFLRDDSSGLIKFGGLWEWHSAVESDIPDVPQARLGACVRSRTSHTGAHFLASVERRTNAVHDQLLPLPRHAFERRRNTNGGRRSPTLLTYGDANP